MKVLFIASGRLGQPGDVVKNQGESLKDVSIDIDYFLIKPGLAGYLMSILKLRRIFKSGSYVITHAHYSLSGIVATLAGCKPLIVSIMGSDGFMSIILKKATRFFSQNFWDITIVKTSGLKMHLKLPDAKVIPNGVDINKFKPIAKTEARRYLGLHQDVLYIIFVAGKNRPEKNLALAERSVQLLNDESIIFRHVHSVDNSDIPYFMNAADVLLLTSNWEGSVNVVKEAMACNCPVVSTDVGDVSWVFGQSEGYYLTTFEPENISINLRKALKERIRTNGRQRIIDLGLDSEIVARKIVDVYRGLVQIKK